MTPDPRLREIAGRIVELLARSGVSGRAFAARAGLSDTHVTKAVKCLGEGRTVTIQTLLQIADAGQVSPGWLVSGEGSGPPLRSLLTWGPLIADTRARYPHVPDFAIDVVGDFVLPLPPDRLDAAGLRDLALAWFSAASDDLRSKAEARYVTQQSSPAAGQPRPDRTKKIPPVT